MRTIAGMPSTATTDPGRTRRTPAQHPAPDRHFPYQGHRLPYRSHRLTHLLLSFRRTDG